MRISHLKLRRAMENMKSNITDKEFFTSSLFRGYLADMADATGKRYKKPIRVKVDWDESEGANVAFTNNQLIYINAASRITAGLATRATKTLSLIGLLAHEVGHILFTDFEKLAKFKGAFGRGEFYPAPPKPSNDAERVALGELLDAITNHHGKYSKRKHKIAITLITTIASGIQNIIEDVYLEARMRHKFPGNYKSGIELINAQLLDGIPSLQQQIDEGIQPLAIMQNLILEYAKSGHITNPENLKNVYTSALYRCLGYIDAGVYDEDIHARFNSANMVLLSLWSFIRDVLDEIKDNEDDNEGDDDNDDNDNDDNDNDFCNSALEELLEQLEEVMSQGGGAPTGNNKPVEGVGGIVSGALEADDTEESESEPRGVTELAETGVNDNGDEAQLNIFAILSKAESDEGVSSDLRKMEDAETRRIPLLQTDHIETEGEGGIEYNRDYAGSAYPTPDIAADIERLLESMTRERVSEALEADLHEELQTLANDINYGNAHNGVKVSINRMRDVPESLADKYNAIAPPLLFVSKRLQKQVSQLLKDRRDGGKLTGLLYGKRFSARDAVRNDGRLFFNTRLPSEPMEIAVAVLNDESGSMYSQGRAEAARAASIVLYDFCCALNIPVAVYGYTASSTKLEVDIFAHAEFDSVDKRDKYRLMDITSRDHNRDGAALRFVAERLLKRPEPLKLLFVISDGQPNAKGYLGTAAEADLRGIKQEYTRKGVKMFCAAIGDDKPNIERIYGDGFLDISKLDKLPQNLCTLLSRYIKVL